MTFPKSLLSLEELEKDVDKMRGGRIIAYQIAIAQAAKIIKEYYNPCINFPNPEVEDWLKHWGEASSLLQSHTPIEGAKDEQHDI